MGTWPTFFSVSLLNKQESIELVICYPTMTAEAITISLIIVWLKRKGFNRWMFHYTHSSHQHRVRSSVLFNDEELIPDPSSFGSVEHLPFLPSPLSVSMQWQVTYEHKSQRQRISPNWCDPFSYCKKNLKLLLAFLFTVVGRLSLLREFNIVTTQFVICNHK